MTAADLERVRMCLAEAGYDPRAAVLESGKVAFSPYVPFYIAWKTYALAGLTHGCWPCIRSLGPILSDDPDWEEDRPPCGHPIDPFCPEDAEIAA